MLTTIQKSIVASIRRMHFDQERERGGGTYSLSSATTTEHFLLLLSSSPSIFLPGMDGKDGNDDTGYDDETHSNDIARCTW